MYVLGITISTYMYLATLSIRSIQHVQQPPHIYIHVCTRDAICDRRDVHCSKLKPQVLPSNSSKRMSLTTYTVTAELGLDGNSRIKLGFCQAPQ